MESWYKFKDNYLIKFWRPTPAIIATGILSAYYFGLTGTLWAVTGEFTRWGGHIVSLFGAEPEKWTYFKMIGLNGMPWQRTDGLLIIGMFLGCFCAALWANNVRIRNLKYKIRIVQAVVGGIIAGFGARLAMGCNLAAFFTGIPQFSLHAWLFAITTALGALLGTKVVLLPIFRFPLDVKKVNQASDLRQDPNRAHRRFVLGVSLFIAVTAVGILLLFIQPKLGIAVLFGVAFGLLIERAQICFTSAFRDLWLAGRTYMTRAIIWGMMASAIGTFAFMQLGVSPKIFWAGPNAILGGLLFGFGIVLAGGCEVGWMYRATEGQTHYLWVGVGNVIGSTILAYYWDNLTPYLVDGFDKVNLLVIVGPYGGLVINYLLMILALVLVLYWEHRYFKKRRANMPVNASSVIADTSKA